jgi:hypothetical protein
MGVFLILPGDRGRRGGRLPSRERFGHGARPGRRSLRRLVPAVDTETVLEAALSEPSACCWWSSGSASSAEAGAAAEL